VEEAKQIALDRAGGGEVSKAERETEHGRKVWSVRINRDDDRVRVDVDAQTGDVVRYKVDDRDDDRDDRDDDGRDGTDDDGDDDRHGRGSDDPPGDDHDHGGDDDGDDD
ncbi:MAG: PepSY domain-containing protein, partial [Micromonosporaceae bacterium]